MATELFFIRHGQSLGNLNNAFLGHFDLPLTELGKEQAALTASYLKNLKPDIIYSSDLKRAYETAIPTSKVTLLPIIKSEGLREIFAGAWENADFHKLSEIDPENFTAWNENFHNARPRDGESVSELMERITKTVLEIVNKNPNKRIFIFTHATPIRLFGAFCLGKKKEEWNDMPWAPNSSTTHVLFENGIFSLIQYGYADYLKDKITSFDKEK